MNQAVNKLSTEYQIARDPEGYLFDPLDWDETVACKLAAEEGIELGETHWPVLRFMREQWTKNRIAPDVRHVVDFVAGEQGLDKKGAKALLYKLFPYGYVKQACKIAGMQRPRVWSTG
ncbi:MAG: TusE/DsrC/DsvC family sulfur relay protein [Gammaproteobacteria bacterium]|nr:TusE/DsrC/DsvC family sulfur relay protein [Gammaproteobacteria bacterium]